MSSATNPTHRTTHARPAAGTIDRPGRRARPARHRANLLLPAVLALLTQLAPSVAADSLCDELAPLPAVAGDATPQPSGGDQIFPAIAAGSDSYLAAWPDNRSDFEPLDSGEGARDVYARRIGSDGSPIDAVPFRIAGGAGRKQRVRVTWNGTHWLVTWSQLLATPSWKAQALLAARVDTTGAVLDDPPIVVHAYDWSSVTRYAVASDGVGWALVTQGSDSTESAVTGHLIGADGSVAQVASGLLSSTSLWGDFELGFASGRYLLAAGSSNTTGRFLTPGLATMGGTFTLAPKGALKLATNGTNYLLTYATGGNGAWIMVRTMTGTGQLGTPVAVTPSSPVEYAYDPVVAWNGAGYTVAYTHDLASPTELRVARISTGGAVLDFGGLPGATGTDARNAQIASLADGRVQMAWVRNAGIEPYVPDVFATHVGESGSAGAQVPLANGQPRQGRPDLAAGGEGYLSVFTSERDGAVSILAQRLDRQGAPQDAEPVEITAGPNLTAPACAWNGQAFLVVWEDPGVLSFPSFESDDRIFGRRLAADGTPLDPAPIELLAGNMPGVDAVGDTFLVAASTPITTEIRRIHGVRVDGTGALLDSPPILLGGNFARWPDVASFGDRWLVTWQRNPTHDNPSASVRCAVVLPDGASLGEVWIDGGSVPDAAASHDTGLVAFAGSDVRAQRVARDGTLLGSSFPLTAQPGLQLEPSAAWTGSEFVVAWEDERDLESLVDDRRDLYAARVQEDGTVVTFDGCPVSATPEPEQMAAVAGRDGDVLVAFARFQPEAPEVNVRIAYAIGKQWTDLGGGTLGSAGVPSLNLTGTLAPGSDLALDLVQAPASTLAGLMLSLQSTPVPYAGGTLHAFPIDFLLLLGTDAAGELHLPMVFPAAPTGLPLWIQMGVADPLGTPTGKSLSNAVTATVP